jgi:hypothetical protein
MLDVLAIDELHETLLSEAALNWHVDKFMRQRPVALT